MGNFHYVAINVAVAVVETTTIYTLMTLDLVKLTVASKRLMLTNIKGTMKLKESR